MTDDRGVLSAIWVCHNMGLKLHSASLLKKDVGPWTDLACVRASEPRGLTHMLRRDSDGGQTLDPLSISRRWTSVFKLVQ